MRFGFEDLGLDRIVAYTPAAEHAVLGPHGAARDEPGRRLPASQPARGPPDAAPRSLREAPLAAAVLTAHVDQLAPAAPLRFRPRRRSSPRRDAGAIRQSSMRQRRVRSRRAASRTRPLPHVRRPRLRSPAARIRCPRKDRERQDRPALRPPTARPSADRARGFNQCRIDPARIEDGAESWGRGGAKVETIERMAQDALEQQRLAQRAVGKERGDFRVHRRNASPVAGAAPSMP